MPLDHILIYVKDLRASEKFYLEALAPIGYKLFELTSLSKGQDKSTVDAFHSAAVKAGGEDNGKPASRPLYGSGYYGAFVKDLDGHNIEVLIRDPPPA
ncbi:hypothetical protein BT69DRAFT_1329088 [Atractiella rhizophila]|nr:hypothetical protein BT69DRAFT_1329088 [Atractiella rhizophila]